MKNKDKNGKFTTFTDSLIGKKFGRLTVVDNAGKSKYGARLWLCQCECGNKTTAQTAQLNNGKKRSCGCLQKEKASEIVFLAHKENQKYKVSSDSSLYNRWSSMLRRCTSSKDKHFNSYGGRGIRVCDEWQDFNNFAEWALANGYDDALTIDRIDVNGNYEPNNCRWVTFKEQANNKRKTKYFEHNGKQKTLSQLADEYGINYKLLYERVVIEHWDLERALATPKMTPQQAVACSKAKRDKSTGRFVKTEVA